jgi:predicted ATPase
MPPGRALRAPPRQAVASALRRPEGAGNTLLARLQEAVRTRDLLLVLDNCEHLLDAWAGLAEVLLRAGPHLRILATSREALGSAGETAWRVPSLALPGRAALPPEVLMHSEAVQLFVERAVAARPDFSLTAANAPMVVHVCQRLEGIPLAIELAAARLRGLGVEQLAARLDQSFRLLAGGSRTALPRQQTLQATVDWSYGLLSAWEQRLFNRLAVFAAGFSLEAAEVVCADDGRSADQVLDGLLRLVDKSLVQAEEREAGVVRYRLLETLRQYGLERLATTGETAAMHRQHAGYYLDLVEQAERALLGPAQAAWLDRLELEHANVEAILEWSLGDAAPHDRIAGEPTAAVGVRLAGALQWFWLAREHKWEGRRWLERALERSADVARTVRARAFLTAGILAAETADRTRAQPLLEGSVVLCRAIGEARSLAYALVCLGFYTRGLEVGLERGQPGDYERGTALLQEGLALAREAGDPWLIAESLLLLAYSSDLHRAEARAAARVSADECVPLMRAAGDTYGQMALQRTYGWLALYEGDAQLAGMAFTSELAAARTLGDRAGVALALSNLGEVARLQGNCSEAQALYEQSLALYRDLDFDRELMARVIRRLGEVALELGDVAQARARLIESLGVALDLVERGEPQIAAALEALGGLAATQGQAERALRLVSAAAALRARISQPQWPHDRLALACWLAAAYRALGKQAQHAAWGAGQALSLENAVALALEVRVATG